MWGYTGTFTKYTTSTLIDGYYVIGASESSSNSSYCAGTTVSSGRITGTTLDTSDPANNIVWIIENTASGWTFNSYGSSTKYIKQTSTTSGKGMAINTAIGYFTLVGYNSSSPKGFKFSSADQNKTNQLKWNNSSKWFSNYANAYDVGMAPVTLYRDNSKYRAKTTQPASGSFTASATGATWDGTKKHLSWMASGTTVTLTATPPSGMAVDTWTVTKASGGTVTVTNNQFTMPADQVTITVTWKSSGTSVSLTKAGQTNGSFTMTQSSTPVTEVTTTSAAQAVTITATPDAGYYLSNLTASNPSTGTATVTGSGNTRTVTYSSGANGSSTITATFSPIWQLRGDFNSWGTTDPLTTYSDGVATITKTLDAMTKYEFKMYNVQESAYYKNTGKIITDISGWDYTSGDGANTFLYTGPAGVYTFKFTLAGRLLQVIYPSVSHPAEGYAYFQQQGGWSACRIYQWDTGGGELTSWENALTISNTANICGTTYYYFALANEYNRVKFRDNGSNQGNELATSGYSAKYTGNNFSSPSWNAFEKYTISFNSGGGSGTMTAISDLCPGSDQAITTNSFTRSNYTFTGWTANVNVKIGGSTVTAGTLIANGATIQDIQSNITLTAQWIQTPVITRSPSVIAFGSKKIDGSYTETFTVSGSNLASSSGLTLAVMGSNTGMYSIDKTEIPQTSAGAVASTTVTVTYHPTTAGSHAGADVRITTSNGVGGTITVSVTLSGTGVYEDTFIDMLQNTTGYTEGSPHTEQGAYGTTPSLSDKSVATSGTCEQQHYHFVGWITAAKYAAGTAISDGDLQTPTTASNATYYAVWAKQGEESATTFKRVQTLDDLNSASKIAIVNAYSSSNYILTTDLATAQTAPTENGSGKITVSSGQYWTLVKNSSNWQFKKDATNYLKGDANPTSSDKKKTISTNTSGNINWVITTNSYAGNGTPVFTIRNASSDYAGLEYSSGWCLYYGTDFNTSWYTLKLYVPDRNYTDYKAICCTDWSTPTVSYSSSIALNASEGVTIGSGTTHGAVTYESSDEDVLTVDADGTIHAVGAGTAHIVATWAGDATYCEKSANSNDVTVSGIQVTGTTPVNFGQVYQNAVVANKTISVTGLGLASDITPSLPAGSPFSFSPASLAKDCSGATLTISASTATLGTYNQTLTLTSGAFSTTVTVKMEVIAKPTATFTDALHGLTEDEDGVSLSSYNLTAAQGTPVVFPTLANQTKSAGTCEGEYYIFVGWTEGDNNTDPEDHLVTSYTLANGDTKNYYAVWADGAGTATYTKLTNNSFSGSPAKYVLGAEHEGTTYYFSDYDPDNIAYNLSWGTCSSSDAPIQFTLSGTASALVAKDNLNNYLEAPCTTKAFYISGSETSVELKSNGTIYNNGDGCTSYRLRYNYNSGSGGLRWYTSDTGDPAYFYLVGAAGTVHYRTSCCANKVDAPVVTATTVTSTSITLTWPSDDKATGWQIEWNGAGGWVTPSGSCTHTVSGLTPNTTYTWRVRATYEDPVCGADVRSGSTTTNQVYHVTYAKGSGTGTCTAEGSTTDATGYEAGATVTLQENEFTLAGHTFAGWTEDDDDITISSNQFTMPDHDVVITASWTAKMDKYFDRMHDQTDELHGGVEETEGTNEGKYYIPKEGCNYSIPTAVDSNTGDACQTSHYKLQGWIAASHMKGYPNNMTGEIKPGEETYIFPPTGTKTATGATYYAIWAEVTE